MWLDDYFLVNAGVRGGTTGSHRSGNDFPPLGTRFAAYLLKFACAVALPLMVTMQVGAVPMQAPLQLLKLLPIGGVAVRTTTTPCANLAEQVLPQLMPLRSLVTVPGLLRPMDKVYCVAPPPPPPAGAFASNNAITLMPGSLTGSTQVSAVPLHAPLQPTKWLLLDGCAVSDAVPPTG